MKIRLKYDKEAHEFETVQDAAKALQCTKPAIYTALKRGNIGGWEIESFNEPKKLLL